MFLDVDSDGENGPADTLGLTGTYEVAVWLTTDHNREGEDAYCASGGDLTINSYTLILRAVGGGVQWGSYTNQQTGMSTTFGTRSGGSDFYCGFGGGEAKPPGTYRLGTVSISITSGSPAIEIAPSSPLGNVYKTSFGSACASEDQDNTVELGVDWFDVSGVGSGESGEGESQSMSASGNGSLFLGGNEIAGPWVLVSVRGSYSANGFVLPPAAGGVTTPSEFQLAQEQFLDRVGSLADSLNRSSVPIPEARERLRAFCMSNEIGATVEASDRKVVVRLRDGIRMNFRLGVRVLNTRRTEPVSPSDATLARLAEMTKYLNEGCVVFIVDRVTKVVVPAIRKDEVVRVIQKIRSNSALGPSEVKLLPERVRSQIRTPLPLVRSGEGGRR